MTEVHGTVRLNSKIVVLHNCFNDVLKNIFFVTTVPDVAQNSPMIPRV